jgi:hypothetical protein
VAEPRSREAFLTGRLGELDGHWLEIRCGVCGALVFYPCKLLAKEGRGSMRVADLLPRMAQMPDRPARRPPHGGTTRRARHAGSILDRNAP